MRKEYADRWNAPLVNGPIDINGNPLMTHGDLYDQLEFEFGLEPSDEEDTEAA